jgi:ABC-type oligopeptide transport system ATPase subunit
MLELRNIYKRFSGIPAVAGASFIAQPGEVTGYLGPNGSGKSTTMKMIAGLMDPSAGEILFEGKPIQHDLIAYKQRMGYVPEEPHLYTHLSGIEYLSMVAQLRNLPAKPAAVKIDGLLHLFNLHGDRHVSISSYSKECARKFSSPPPSSTTPTCSSSTSHSPDSTSARRSSCAASFRSSPAEAKSSSSAPTNSRPSSASASTSSSCIAERSSPMIQSNICAPSCPCPPSKKSSPSSPSSKTPSPSRGRSPTSSMSEATTHASDPKQFEKQQFRVLFREFRLRVIDLELLSTDGDPSKLLGQFTTLLLSFSFLVSLPILLFGAGRMPPEPTWTMEHFLIATTMVVVGLFAVLSWDSAFPDRRDVLVLGPLPVRTQTLFVAKLAAFAASLALPVVAINAFAGLLWPMLFSPANSGFLGVIRALAAYWITVLAAATFVSGFALLIQGAATHLLPRQIFLRISALLQVLTFCLFLTMYILEPSLESVAARTNPANQHLLACLPTYWFLGLFQQLNGSLDPGFVPLANRAWLGLAITILGTVATILLAYFRTLRKIVEQPDILPGSRHGSWSPRLGDNLQTAVLLFTVRTLLRSRQHRMVLSFYLGIGFTIMLVFLDPSLASLKIAHVSSSEQASVPFLAVSILMMCVAAAAVRVVFALPITLRANWIYRITEIRSVTLYSKALRRTFLLLVIAPVWTIFAALFLTIWPWKLAVPHLLCFGLFGVILCELAIYRFHKVPFTCSYLPGKGNVQFGFWIFFALLALSPLLAATEWEMLQKPATLALLLLAMCSVAIAARWRTTDSDRSAEAMQFDETDTEGIVSLNLGADVVQLHNPS